MNIKFVLLFVVFAALAGTLIFQATQETSSAVLVPSDLAALGSTGSRERIRVGGRVTEDAIEYRLEPEIELRFRIRDPKGDSASVPVVYRGLRPDMFAAGRDVIIDGDYDQGLLRASKLLTQCPSKYEAPLPGTEDHAKEYGNAK